MDIGLALGRVLWLKLDDDPSTGLIDSAGGHTVSCAEMCPIAAPGKIDRAYQFSGDVRQRLMIDYRADLAADVGFTVATWFSTDLYTADGQCVVSKPFGKGDQDSYGLCVSASPAQDVVYYTFDGQRGDRAVSGDLTLKTWHHLAISWDGVTKRSYFDGQQVASNNVAIVSDDHAIVIGGDANVGAPVYPFAGLIDDVMIWNRALSDLEIMSLIR